MISSFKLRMEVQSVFSYVCNWTWENCEEHSERIAWHKLSWFPSHIQKHAVMAWMAILDRLPTTDRLIRMGIVVPSLCCLCRLVEES
ncbi:hypothetical protein V6N11_020267 [Hibiscus sabdariffa]|uniref:Reverse transcriptase zinc-binding domain-containing protein n=1 Tax=Hibiscus sabdariffa TaxID=183260 RepID=A0ABR2Q7W7_9ROSI